MKIVVAARCRNDEQHIERFLNGYDFVDTYVISDGGSTDNSIKLFQKNKKVQLHHFKETRIENGVEFNEDAPHMNFVLNMAKELEPDWLILDDVDDIPNSILRLQARNLLERTEHSQVNAFRLYMWGEKKFFPKMNNYFDHRYTSLWAWKPKELNIWPDGEIIPHVKDHVALRGLHHDPYKIELPKCLLHYSWDKKTIRAKLRRYEAMSIPMQHPFIFAGKPVDIPEWAVP